MHRVEESAVIRHLRAALDLRHGVPGERIDDDLAVIARMNPNDPVEPAIRFLCGQLLIRPQSRA